MPGPSPPQRHEETRLPEEFPWDEFAQFPWDDEHLGARPLGAPIKDGIFLTSYEGFEAGSVQAVEPTDQYGAHAAKAFEVAFDLKVTPGATPTGIAARYFADKNSEFADTEVDMANEGLTSGDGFSFSFGDIAEGLVSERGAGRGLRVQFLTYTHNVVRVLLHGRPVASVPFRMVFNETVGVSIAVERSELNLLGATTLAHLPLPAVAAGARLADGGRRAQRGHAKHEVSTVRWLASRFDERRAGAVEVSANAQDYSADGVACVPPPLALMRSRRRPARSAAARPSPSLAPPSAAVPTTRLASARRSCPPPTATPGATARAPTCCWCDRRRRAPPASVVVRVTTNGQQYVDAPPFGYYDAPVVSAVSPTRAAARRQHAAHTARLLRGRLSLPLPLGARRNASLGRRPPSGRIGTHFSRDYEWEQGTHFGAPTVDATYDSAAPHVLSCVTPAGLDFARSAWRCRSTRRSSRRRLSTTRPTTRPPPRPLAELGTADGATHVRVRGVALAGGSHYLCRFGDVQPSTQTYVSDAATLSVRTREPTAFVALSYPAGRVECASPLRTASAVRGNGTALGAAGVEAVEVSLNGQQFTSTAMMELTDEGASYRRGTTATGFAHAVAPSGLCPSTGPELGGTAVFVTSSHLPRDTSGELIEGTALRIDWTHTMATDADDCGSIHLPALEEAYRLTVFGNFELDTVDRVDATAECSAGDLTISAAIRRLSEDETTPLYLAVPTIDAAHLNEGAARRRRRGRIAGLGATAARCSARR